jgi:hypothetical protein
MQSGDCVCKDFGGLDVGAGGCHGDERAPAAGTFHQQSVVICFDDANGGLAVKIPEQRRSVSLAGSKIFSMAGSAPRLTGTSQLDGVSTWLPSGTRLHLAR